MRWPRPTVGRERRRNFGDIQPVDRCLHDHLACELHAGGLKSERENRIAREAAQSAVEIAAGAVEENTADGGQHRIAEIAMERWHGASSYTALEAITHHEVAALSQLLYEQIEVAEIVAVVAVTHYDKTATCRTNTRHQRAAIALGENVDHSGSMLLGNQLGSVSAAVVGDHDFAVDPAARNVAQRLIDTACQRLSFVEARHQDSQFVRSGHALPSRELSARSAMRTSR